MSVGRSAPTQSQRGRGESGKLVHHKGRAPAGIAPRFSLQLPYDRVVEIGCEIEI
jgi:hypothetical protein